jgi:hypothetical protein
LVIKHGYKYCIGLSPWRNSCQWRES